MYESETLLHEKLQHLRHRDNREYFLWNENEILNNFDSIPGESVDILELNNVLERVYNSNLLQGVAHQDKHLEELSPKSEIVSEKESESSHIIMATDGTDTSNVKNEVVYECERCGHKTNDRSNFMRHIKRKRICPPTFKNTHRETMLKAFERSYIDDTYDCICGKRYNSRQGLFLHKRKCMFQGLNNPSPNESLRVGSQQVSSSSGEIHELTSAIRELNKRLQKLLA